MSPAGHPADDQLDAATWCGHLVPAGSVYAFLADHRHELFPPELFADVARQGGGHPSVPAEVIATVMVLQALEGLSDREAVSALRRDIAWKVAFGLRLDDEGFHPTLAPPLQVRDPRAGGDLQQVGQAAALHGGRQPGQGVPQPLVGLLLPHPGDQPGQRGHPGQQHPTAPAASPPRRRTPPSGGVQRTASAG